MNEDGGARKARIAAAAECAAAEAEARRRAGAVHVNDPASRPREVGGRAGAEPVRYGDWEKNGRATDF